MSKTADEVSEVVEALRTHGSDDCDEAAGLLERLQKRNEELEGQLINVANLAKHSRESGESFDVRMRHLKIIEREAREFIQGVPNE